MTQMKKRILVVEDEPSVLKMVQARFDREGFDVLISVDGEDALRQVSSDPSIQLVLLDLDLPKRSGYEVCRTLKQQPATAHIPVILYTGVLAEVAKIASESAKVGAYDWIEKPFTTKELLSKNGADTDLIAVQQRESELLRRCWESPEHAEAVRSFLRKG